MSQSSAYHSEEAVYRLAQCDPTLVNLVLWRHAYTDDDVRDMVDCLLTYPSRLNHINMAHAHLTDETGVKLARYVAADTSIRTLTLYDNEFGDATYMAFAAALRTNTSLIELYLDSNRATPASSIDVAFLYSLRCNPRQPESWWRLFSTEEPGASFNKLNQMAKCAGPLSMLEYLAIADE